MLDGEYVVDRKRVFGGEYLVDRKHVCWMEIICVEPLTEDN